MIYGPPASAALPRPASGDFSVTHPRVNDFVATYQTRWRGFYQRALERGSRYLSRMTRVLREESVPEELAYLPVVESGFRTQVVSQAGAAGPWQFIPATGRRYGLRIDGYVDERCDPVKSTHAAARYLKDLYAQFGDWHLSLAAYNTGEMNIARLLDRSKTDNYWEMSDRGYLPNETRDFVPQFLAVVRIAQAPEAYGFEAPNDDPLHYDLVHVDRSVSLKTVAKFANASEAEMTELNPALRRGITPPQGYTMRVPKGTKEIVLTALARMHHDAAQVMPAPRVHATAVARTHKVRRGETLGAVAKRHRVSVASLKKANRLRGNRIAAGRSLRIPGRAPVANAPADKKPVRVASRRAR
ncbi:MAG TPA: transglycosylase SLT domain-containing protein [Pseudomonadales bacterium]|nr:transglycosylase SLT domain-containing protein [Pseudomonadales bacterium]